MMENSDTALIEKILSLKKEKMPFFWYIIINWAKFRI